MSVRTYVYVKKCPLGFSSLLTAGRRVAKIQVKIKNLILSLLCLATKAVFLSVSGHSPRGVWWECGKSISSVSLMVGSDGLPSPLGRDWHGLPHWGFGSLPLYEMVGNTIYILLAPQSGALSRRAFTDTIPIPVPLI